MAADPRAMRASDDDRDRAASLLREHHAAGRLTAEEFSERLDKALQARTIGDLDDLLADLPGIDLYRLPDASVRRGRPRPGGFSHFEAVAAAGAAPADAAAGSSRLSPAWRAAWGSWLSCALFLFVIWAISGAGYPWPLWIAGPFGAILLGRWLTGSAPGDRQHHDQHHRHHHHHGRVGSDERDQIDGGPPGP